MLHQVLGAHPPSALWVSARSVPGLPGSLRRNQCHTWNTTKIFTFDRMKHNKKLQKTGVIIVPTQTMHYYNGNPSKIPRNLHCLIPPKMGNVMTRVFMNSSLLNYYRCSFGILSFQPSFCFYTGHSKTCWDVRHWNLRMSKKNTITIQWSLRKWVIFNKKYPLGN